MHTVLTSYDRILRTVRGEPVDRVPIFPPLPWHPLDPLPTKGWLAEPNYRAVAELVAQYCDCLCNARTLGGYFDRRFLLIPQEYIQVTAREREGSWMVVTYQVNTPQGPLRTVEKRQEGVSTVWYTEPLLKDKEDVEKLLSVPFHFDPPDLAPFFAERDRVQPRGVMQIGVSTPMVCVSRLLDFQQFLLWCAAERDTIRRLIDTVFERIYLKLEYLLQHGVGPVFWFGGSEQATPPMMSPQFYDELVVAYDSQLFDLVHRYGGYVHVHCHGKVNGVFERIIEMGADMLDPLEPPPDGDLPIAEAKRRAQGRITLMGNIEFRDLEFATPEEIDAKVREAICSERKDHFMLYPSATAISAISDRYRDNAIQYIQSGLEYGKLDIGENRLHNVKTGRLLTV